MTDVIVERPTPAEYAQPFERYVSLVQDGDVLAALTRQGSELAQALSGVGAAAERFRYADGKWSIREVVGHVIDSERVFGYRALCIARGEQAPLPGFDENAYQAHASFDASPLAELLREFALVREGHLPLFRRLSGEAWLRSGVANSKPASVRALAFIMVGHVRHHLGVLRERYLPLLGP
jgi:hypothetical protein